MSNGLPDPIPAATVMILRDSCDGVEVLMLRRSAAIAFGGMWSFPGGRLDADDGHGIEGFERAAVREVHEECALVLSVDDLVPIARWCPPPVVSKRFDTWFFVANASSETVIADGDEMVDHRWISPAEVLDLHAAGTLEVAVPTWVMLHRIRRFGCVADVLLHTRREVVETFATRLITNAGAPPVATWQGDSAYGTGRLTDAGGRHRLVMAPGQWSYEQSESR